MNNIRAYEVKAAHIRCLLGYVDGYGVWEYYDIGDIVYATTRAQAKHLFIKQQRDAQVDYTTPMKIRLLAKNVVQTEDVTPYGIDADWCKGELTPYGETVFAEQMAIAVQIEKDFTEFADAVGLDYD
jgi:hypothetical protein